MFEVETYDGHGTKQNGGLVQFGTASPGDNIAELTIIDRVLGTEATVLLDHHAAVALMAQLGQFVASI